MYFTINVENKELYILYIIYIYIRLRLSAFKISIVSRFNDTAKRCINAKLRLFEAHLFII